MIKCRIVTDIVKNEFDDNNKFIPLSFFMPSKYPSLIDVILDVGRFDKFVSYYPERIFCRTKQDRWIEYWDNHFPEKLKEIKSEELPDWLK